MKHAWSSLGFACLLLFAWSGTGFSEEPAADEADLAPASLASPEPSEEAILASIPFAEGPIYRVMVNLAEPGKKPLVVMLDTGASGNVMTPRMARSLGVSIRPGKTAPYRRATRLDRDFQFWIDVSSSDTASKTGFEYALLGGEFLDDYVVEIDYPGRKVRFLDPKKYEVPKTTQAPNESVVEFKRAGTRIFTDLEIDGKKGRVLLDTGAPGPILLLGRSLKKMGLDPDRLEDWGEVGGVLGKTEARFMEAQKISWAGFDFEGAPLLVLPRGFFNQAGGTDSVIGYDFLHHFTLRIDYKRKRLWLRKPADLPMTFWAADYQLSKRLGAQLTSMPAGDGTTQYAVWSVQPGGTAAKAGLRNNDVIVGSLNENLTSEDILDRIESGKDLTVARKDGDFWVDISIPEPVYMDPIQPEDLE